MHTVHPKQQRQQQREQRLQMAALPGSKAMGT